MLVYLLLHYWILQHYICHGISRVWRSQWPCGLRRRSTAARLLRQWVRIPPGAWMSVCCECCVLSGRGLCDALITRPEESYRLWCVVVCDLETSRMMTMARFGPQRHGGGMPRVWLYRNKPMNSQTCCVNDEQSVWENVCFSMLYEMWG